LRQLSAFSGVRWIFFGTDRQVTSIRPKDVKDFTRWLAKIITNRGTPLTKPSIRHHLNALSRLYRRGRELEVVPLGYNPVAELLEKPKKGDYDAAYLEVHDAALFLEAARLLPPPPCIYQSAGSDVSIWGATARSA
jgi:hypothetical protein